MASLLISWDDATNPERNELVFENRNRAYGAYVIRKKYEKNIVIAFVIALTALLLALSIPFISRLISDFTAESQVKLVDDVTLMDPPPIDETQPPPPPVVPPPPVQQTIKFTPPIVTKDEDVPQDEPPPTQDDLKDNNAGTTTQAGDSGAVDLPPETPVGDPDEGKIFTIVEEMPMFPGGEGALVKYLQDNIKYPAVARENGITGTVYLTFVVGKDGNITDVKVLRGIGAGCDQEAIRVVKSMPSWKIGKQAGRPVAVQYNLPVRFSLK